MKNDKKAKFLPMVLVILDGWGIAPDSASNAISLAKKPFFNFCQKHFPYTQLEASGKFVGLPKNQDGNSEAGHLNIGAGRIVKQEAVIISEAIDDGRFFKNPALLEAVDWSRKYNSNLHLMGLLSNGESAHSDPHHLYALLDFIKRENFHRVYLHLFTDGRDSSPHAASRLVSKLINNFQNNEIISTIIGRFYAMDRIKKWNRTEMAYNAMVLGEGIASDNPYKAVSEAYNRNETDEFITPTVVLNPQKKAKFINDNDAIIFFNLRSDRARQMTKPFVQKNFEKENKDGFKRKKILKNIKFIALTDFGPDLDDIICAFPPIILKNTLPLVLKDYKQLYLAEREKYAHVTYFFNGGYGQPINGEKWQVISSLGKQNYERYPQMSAYSLTNLVCGYLKNKKFDFITINFANADMIGHTGNEKAVIKAIEIVDKCLAKIYKAILKRNGTIIITADHGNAEEMVNLKSGEIDTEHSTALVPFLIGNKNINKSLCQLRKEGVLGDIAPTILDLLKIKKPKEMTGKSLLKSKICDFKL